MKKWLKGVCSAVFAAILCLGTATTALAHTMTEEEATMILPKPPHGQFEITPFHSTLYDIRAGLGADFKEEDFTGDGMRFVTYDYHGLYSFFARTGANDDRDAKELTVTGYEINGGSLHTPSHVRVHNLYDDVVAIFGKADHVLREESGVVSYIYDFAGRPTQLVFDVNDEGRIRAIHFYSEL